MHRAGVREDSRVSRTQHTHAFWRTVHPGKCFLRRDGTGTLASSRLPGAYRQGRSSGGYSRETRRTGRTEPPPARLQQEEIKENSLSAAGRQPPPSAGTAPAAPAPPAPSTDRGTRTRVRIENRSAGRGEGPQAGTGRRVPAVWRDARDGGRPAAGDKGCPGRAGAGPAAPRPHLYHSSPRW